MSSLPVRLGELQRSVRQLEDSVGEAADHPPDGRARIADELQDLTVRLAHARVAILQQDLEALEE